MKKLHITTVSLLAVSILLIAHSFSKAYSTGSAGGYSSSKGDNTRSCGKNGCHGGGNITEMGWVTTNIPSTGYELGKEYTITVQASVNGITRYGFELSAEDASGNKVGDFNAVGVSDYTIISGSINPSGNGHATHTSNGIDDASGSKKWNVKWTAPQTGNPGTITFSAAILASNKDLQSTGDACHISSLTVQPNPTVGISNLQQNVAIKLFPNPVKDQVSIVLSGIDKAEINIVSISGIVIKKINKNDSNIYDITDLPTGHYIVVIEQNGVCYKKQLIKL